MKNKRSVLRTRDMHLFKKVSPHAILLLGLLLCLLTAMPVHAASTVKKVSVPFSNRTILLSWDWNDFKTSSIKGPNSRLAAAGIAIAGNCADSGYGSHPYEKVERTAKALGFTKSIRKLHFDKDEMNRPASLFAMSAQKVNRRTVVLAVFRGTTNWQDIKSDVQSQTDGFQTPGRNALADLKKYLSDNKLTSKNTILYIVGHSYGAAVASRVALEGASLAPQNMTYVYTYACPNYYTNGTGASDFYNFYNYVNKADVVPKVPVRIDCGKGGSITYFDYKNMTNKSRKHRFDLAFRYLVNTPYQYYPDVFKEHMDYTYMAMVMADMGTTEIQGYFSKEMIVPTLSSVSSPSAGKAAIKWKQVSHADGYEISYSQKKSSGFKLLARVSGRNTLSYTKSGLMGGKRYYFKVRSLMNIDGQYYYSGYSATKSVEVKKPQPSISLSKTSQTLYVGKTATLTATVKNTTKSVIWSSSNKNVATVSTKGKITAKKAGTATITATIKGTKVKATCKVTVKKMTDLTSYYRKPYSSIIQTFPGGSYQTRYAEYNYYTWKDGITFSFPKPVADQQKSPASMINLTKNVNGYCLLGVTIGMNKDTAFKKLTAAGFKRTTAVGITYYWEGSNYRQLAVEADATKIISIRYGSW
ncbi:MAG: Ig-like domain-containing protein [Blautia sp.]|nr:Ig-like domain-containing protein [Blautia sp.]